MSCYNHANRFLLPSVGWCSGSAKRPSHRGREMKAISASLVKKHLMYLQMQLCQCTQLKKKLGLKKKFRPRTHPYCKILCEEATITQNSADGNYLLQVKRNNLTVASFAGHSKKVSKSDKSG